MLCRVNPCLIPPCDQAILPSAFFGCDFEILELCTEDLCDTGHSCSPSNPGPHHLPQAWAQGLALPQGGTGTSACEPCTWPECRCPACQLPGTPSPDTRFLVEGGPAPWEGTWGLGPLLMDQGGAGWVSQASAAPRVLQTHCLRWVAEPRLTCDLPTAAAPWAKMMSPGYTQCQFTDPLAGLWGQSLG